jgi:hypothetical protein
MPSRLPSNRARIVSNRSISSANRSGDGALPPTRTRKRPRRSSSLR